MQDHTRGTHKIASLTGIVKDKYAFGNKGLFID
jgi:hypothetical protein